MNIEELEISPSLKKGFVYYAKNNINSKIYIGLTTSYLCTRKAAHTCSSKRGSMGYFHLALKKYNFNFKWGILFESNNINILKKKEGEFIQLFETNNRNKGYNLSTGGEHTKFNDETKRKISEKAKVRLSIPENNPFYNKTHSDLTKFHLSKIRKGKRPNNGFVKHSQETKDRLSEIRKKLCKNPKFTEKMKLYNQLRIKIYCNETKETFETLKDAAKRLGFGYSYFKKHFSLEEKVGNFTFKKLN